MAERVNLNNLEYSELEAFVTGALGEPKFRSEERRVGKV